LIGDHPWVIWKEGTNEAVKLMKCTYDGKVFAYEGGIFDVAKAIYDSYQDKIFPMVRYLGVLGIKESQTGSGLPLAGGGFANVALYWNLATECPIGTKMSVSTVVIRS
jgi:hypothetical protein